MADSHTSQRCSCGIVQLDLRRAAVGRIPACVPSRPLSTQGQARADLLEADRLTEVGLHRTGPLLPKHLEPLPVASRGIAHRTQVATPGVFAPPQPAAMNTTRASVPPRRTCVAVRATARRLEARRECLPGSPRGRSGRRTVTGLRRRAPTRARCRGDRQRPGTSSRAGRGPPRAQG